MSCTIEASSFLEVVRLLFLCCKPAACSCNRLHCILTSARSSCSRCTCFESAGVAELAWWWAGASWLRGPNFRTGQGHCTSDSTDVEDALSNVCGVSEASGR